MTNRMKSSIILLIFIFIACTVQAGKKQGTADPFEIYNADSTSSLRLQFTGQLRLTFDSRDNGSNNDRDNKFQIQAKRIRLVLSGTIYDPDISYILQVNAAPKTLELIDFYFNYRFNPDMQLRFGQFRPPFTRYRLQSFQRLTFVDWAIVSKYFGAERQMGMAVHNGYDKPPQWGYVFGIFTGVNARASHALGLSLVYAEEIGNPSSLADPAGAAEFHPEIFLHLTHNANNIKLHTDSDEERTGLRYSLGISSAWDLDPIPYEDFTLRLAPELSVKYGGLSFITVGYAGFSEMCDNSEIDLAMTGALFQAAYRFNAYYEISIRYAFVEFQNKLTDHARDRALRIIDDSEDDPDVIAQYADAGQISKEQELTIGFNIYIMGHSLKLQNDFGWLRHSRAVGNLNDYLARSQFQIGF